MTVTGMGVLRKMHPLPRVNNTLAQLACALFSTKLMLIPDYCRFLWRKITFVTPFGRHHFSKLPFGIASAIGHFQ